ncbi:hypothetical protein BCR33DRAFT_718248 [Rhizoclosmatium globosum]|uniref:Acid protease n=1 Tax=Rhizoclosmatium globosum TaxID=329046 RepID=A0A1Y2C6P1_9FUNG|nr:hypothetical protein BCR33DRAFT_718248 [Rhizoclosmatium globosum]|eukprot:ORY42554.1 hypothetical protein BCR33DRAFT_718248 [Rhizoclosmatium globosum]
MRPTLAALFSVLACKVLSQNTTSQSTATSDGGVIVNAGTNPLTITACGPASVDDYGVLLITSTLLNTKSTNTATNASTLVYTILDSGSLIVTPAQFTQATINTPPAVNPVQVAPQALLIKQINGNLQVNISLSVKDQFQNSATCSFTVTVNYNFAPYLAISSPTITTVPNQPVVITSSIFKLMEKHGLSAWNLNLTYSWQGFSTQNYGYLEVYKQDAKSWILLPLTQVIPYQWIDQGALRYNPGATFIGAGQLIFQVINSRGFKMTPWVTGGAAATLSATIQITCNAATNTTKIVPVPAPSQAGTYCFTKYPSTFQTTSQSPLGPYCSNFTTTAGVSTAQVLDQTLLPSLTLSTSVNAAVFWGASVAPTLDYIPTGYTPIRFAGYLDSGAWFIAFTPTTASITSGTPPAITFTTPEMAFDQVPGGVNGVPLNQITGIAFDPVSKTSSQFFPPPQITMALSMALSNPAFFMLLQANVNQGIGVSVNVQWGQVQYLGSWQSRTFNYPYAKYGTMSMTVTSAVDLQIVVLNTCATTWVPGGAAKFDCFTISATTSSAATVSVSVSLGYVWNSNLNADYNYVTPTQIAWCRFISALDGGSWDSTLSGKPNVAGGFVNVTATGTQLGQWAVFSLASASERISPSLSLLLLAVLLTTVF